MPSSKGLVPLARTRLTGDAFGRLRSGFRRRLTEPGQPGEGVR